MDDLIDAAAQALGLDSTGLIVALVVTSMVSQLVARLIPDDSTGWKGTVRSIASVVGLYASSRVTKGITVRDVVKEVAKVEKIPEVAERVDERVEEAVDVLELEANQRFKPPFPGLQSERSE